MNKESFSVKELYPQFVVNTKGEKKEFDESKIASVLNKETGLDMKIAENVAEDVLRKVIGMGKDEIKTTHLREIVCLELTKRGLNKHRNLFARAINLEDISFKLDEEFLEKYKGKQPDWGPLGYFTYKRTYARVIYEEDRKEEFWETLKRVVEGCYSIQKEHCKKLSLPWDEGKAQESAQRMWEKIWNFKMTPPGRGFWIMGTEHVNKHGSMALNNCGFASTADIDLKYTKAFEFVMDALMLGVGVGFDTKGAGKITIKEPADGHFKYTIPDSREGWVEALKYMLEAYFLGHQIPEYDYSEIRPAGEPIRGFGGVASGPEPLKEMLKDMKEILDNRVGEPITSVDIVDLMNLIGKCVIAGNVRRSAEIALGEPTDLDFITCKQDKEKLYSHRWASNNSVFAKKGLDYSFIADQIAVNGEPGVFWLENARAYSRMKDDPDYKDKKAAGVNPCGEQTLESFELCCLAETFPSHHDSFEEFKETLKYAYLYAKSVTLINTHWKETNAVMLKNRRIGISQTGITEAFVKHGRRKVLDWCDKGYEHLQEIDEKYSSWLCIPKSIKLTTVKPSGTVSILAGVTSGIHYPHSEYYIRRVRVSSNSDLIDILEDANYRIEEDQYSNNTMVIEFPCHCENFSRGKEDVSIWEQAENAAAYQKYWSDNQVSVTVTFKPEETDEIEHVLECFEDKLKAISFLPIKEHGYEQAPYEEITEEEYEERVADLKPLKLSETVDEAIGEKFCDSETCKVDYSGNQKDEN